MSCKIDMVKLLSTHKIKKVLGKYCLFTKLKAETFVSYKGDEVYSSPLITKVDDEQLLGINI